MAWQKIAVCLENKNFSFSGNLVSSAARKIIEEIYGKELTNGLEINFQPPALFIKTQNPILKNDLFLKQNTIFAKLKEKLKNQEVQKLY